MFATAQKANAKPSNSSFFQGDKGNDAFIQNKLNIGKAGDAYEVEADRAADTIVAKGNDNSSTFFSPAPTVQRQTGEEDIQEKCAECVKEDTQVQQKPLLETITPLVQRQAEEEPLQEKANEQDVQRQGLLDDSVQEKPDARVSVPDIQQQEGEIQEKEDEEIQEKEEDVELQKKPIASDNPEDSASLESSLNRSKGSGQGLSKSTKNEMESGFGTDFGNVKAHTDSNAVQMNQSLGSQAFTHGNDIYFNEGKYSPESDSGKHLLAHELTHTVQQGASVQPKMIQKNEDLDGTSSTDIEPTTAIDITNGLTLSEEWLAYIEANSRQRKFMVNVKIGDQFTGTIALKKLGRAVEGEPRKFELNSSRRENYLDVGGMDFLNPLRNVGVHPILVLTQFGEEQQTSGFLSIRKGEEALTRDVLGMIKGINENLESMQFLGLSPIEGADGLQNEFTGGGLNFNANNLSLNVDGYLEAQAAIGITNSSFTFEVNAMINVAGLAEGELQVARGEDGGLSGNATITADIANVSATIQVEYDRGAVTIQGTGQMNSEKFSGEITFLVTDAAKSQQMMNAALGVTAMEAEAEGPAPSDAAPVAKTKDNQVMAGWGTVQASITPWLEGTASIGIDNEGHVTIVGEIVVPDEIELMEQRGKKTDLFDVEIRAGYGIPLVGQVFLFASIGMFVNAGFGPLVLKNVGFTGTYSTDPNILQQFSITGTLGINAFAVLGLEAEAGVGLTLLGHDIKAGVNVTAAAGLRAYAEATPILEYIETEAPEGGKIGESRLKGHFEAAAQLFMQLSGALFYELDSPWWSPAPDGREESPLGEVQYPIGDSLGIGADMDWLIGSSEAPELTFSPVEFDPDKFTADVMADPPPRPLGDADAAPEGEWTGEPGSDQNTNPEITGDGEGLPPNSRREEDLSNLPDEQKYMRGLDEISKMGEESEKPAMNEVQEGIRRTKSRYGLDKAEIREETDDSVKIYVKHVAQDNGRHLIEIHILSASEKQRLIEEGLAALRAKEQAYTEDGKISKDNAEKAAEETKAAFYVFSSIRVVDGEDSWDFVYAASPDTMLPSEFQKAENEDELPESTLPIYGGQSAVGLGTSMTIEVLTRKGPEGTETSGMNFGNALDDRYENRESTKRFYVLGHLLSSHLHGPAEMKNLSAQTTSSNRIFESQVEGNLRQEVNNNAKNAIFNYKVVLSHGARSDKAGLIVQLESHYANVNTAIDGSEDSEEKKQNDKAKANTTLTKKKQIITLEDGVPLNYVATVIPLDYTLKNTTDNEKHSNFAKNNAEIPNDLRRNVDSYFVKGQLPIEDTAQQAANAAATAARRRAPRGERLTNRSSPTRITQEIINHVKALSEEGKTRAQIAETIGISTGSVSNILKNI